MNSRFVRVGPGLVWRLAAPLLPRSSDAGNCAEEEENRPVAGWHRVELHRRGLGHVRVRQLALPESEGRRAQQLSGQWFEGSIKPALGKPRTGQLERVLRKVSAAGERRKGRPTVSGGTHRHSRWTISRSAGGQENPSGPAERRGFHRGTGAVHAGSTECCCGTDRRGRQPGGYWTNVRKAFAFAAIGRVNSGAHKVEAFYLDRDDLPEKETGTRLWGANYEYALGEHSTFGATYMKFFSDPAVNPERDGLNVFNLRAYTAPVPSTPDLSFEFEYASERNGDLLSSNALTLQGSYALSKVSWKPTFSYCYAFFQGDDPATNRNENFDPLLPGFSDWGYWWQGEIVGEYIAANSA